MTELKRSFNTVKVLSEEIKNPEKTMPRAIMLAFGVSTLLYIGVSAVEVGLLNWKIVGASSAPLEISMRALCLLFI
ncbi:MAG: hypothetical protein J5U17_04935 [Candidatus Methanoperedens sp.]|nr:hypothetical protein [Candidatus Methanoperedens sp.]MCE8427759.1 hypothetical protein [Candidatus Methanoperedens sp.]